VLQCVKVHYRVLQCAVAEHLNTYKDPFRDRADEATDPDRILSAVLQYVAVCCSMLQCVAVCCDGVSQHIHRPLRDRADEATDPDHTTTHPRCKALTLQHTHTDSYHTTTHPRCNALTLQHTHTDPFRDRANEATDPDHIISSVLQCVAVCCSMLRLSVSIHTQTPYEIMQTRQQIQIT